VTLADVKQLRDGRTQTISQTVEKISPLGIANSSAVRHPVGTVILSRTASVGFSAILGADMATSQDFATWTCGNKIDPKFLLHSLRAMAPDLRRVAMGSTHKTIYMPDIANLRVTLPPLGEQRQIANFLDAETARLDNLTSLRIRQVELIKARLNQIGDSIIAARRTGVAAIDSHLEKATWIRGKLNRVCSIVPGFAFASDDYVKDGEGVRLLRGVNVGVDSIDWTDTAAWDVEAKPVSPLFRLADGDVVVGMDRPWIKGGARVATIHHSDLPALLLQRVARLRPKSQVDMQYVKLALRSIHFKQAIESELTGVSVPHLSADQIGGFELSLPDIETQRRVTSLYSVEEATAAGLNAVFRKQIVLIQERRQALITAAVTGRLKVTTGRGADLS
jgi:type I restriction enzyme S subunit